MQLTLARIIGGYLVLVATALLIDRFTSRETATASAAAAPQTDEREGARRRRRSRRQRSSQHVEGEEDAVVEDSLLDRLIRERFVCGICLTADVRSVEGIAFQCGHYTCSACYTDYKRITISRVSCPFCRDDVVAAKQIDQATLRRAELIMRWVDRNF